MPDLAELIAAKVNPPAPDVWTPLGWVPTTKQKEFHDLSAKRLDAILYGGSAGGGKSSAILLDAIRFAATYPNMRLLLLRRTYNELNESFLAELSKRQFAKPLGSILGGQVRWNATERILKFPNSAIINFSYAENEQDASRIQGGEYQYIGIDEASLLSEVVIERIEERLRSGSRGLPVIGLRLASNPGGISHNYLRNRFIRPTKHGKEIAVGLLQDGVFKFMDDGRDHAFIPAKATDNPHLDSGYMRVLDSISDPARRAAMRDGDWSAVSGAFFEQFVVPRHCVPAFPVPKVWPHYCGIDYGYAAPFAAVFAAEDNDGRLWVYRELYLKQVQAEDQARLILETEERDRVENVIRVADPSMWGQRGTPMTIADIYGLNGCGIMQADNDRLNGWSRVHSYLNDGSACEYHREQGWDTCPMLHVFNEECPNFVDEVTSLPRSASKPDDAETKNVADHICDALRYLCMAVGTHARPVIYDQPTPDALEKLRREQAAAFNPNPGGLVAGRFGGNLGLGLSDPWAAGANA